jgi:hypothetical protein
MLQRSVVSNARRTAPRTSSQTVLCKGCSTEQQFARVWPVRAVESMGRVAVY